jgi:hypothetical protein
VAGVRTGLLDAPLTVYNCSDYDDHYWRRSPSDAGRRRRRHRR